MKQSDRLLKAAYGSAHKSPRKKKEEEIKSQIPSSANKRAREETFDHKTGASKEYSGDNSPIGKIRPYILHVREEPAKHTPHSATKGNFQASTSAEPVDSYINRTLFTSKDLEEDPSISSLTEDASANARIKIGKRENSHFDEGESSQIMNTQEKEIINEICQKSSRFQDFHPHRASHSDTFLQPYDVFNDEKLRISGRSMSVSIPRPEEFHVEKVMESLVQPLEKVVPATSFRHLSDMLLLPTPLGMSNSGNACYIITVITALRSVPCFYQWINHTYELDDGKMIFSLFHAYFRSSLEKTDEDDETKKYCNPKNILECLKSLSAFFRSEAQEDAHEGFLTLTNIIEEQSKGMGLEKSWSSLHYWEFELTITCENCGHTLQNHETMSCLSICIPEGCTDSDGSGITHPCPTLVSTMVNSFLYDTEKRQHLCVKCAHNVAVCRRMVTKYPQVMVLHIIRFRTDKRTQEQKKVHAEILATPIVNVKADKERGLPYSFCAVISHLGESIESGHYICDFLHPRHNQDHSDVYPTPEQVLPVAETTAAACEVYTQNDAHVVSGTQEQRTLVSTLALRSRTSYLFFYQLG